MNSFIMLLIFVLSLNLNFAQEVIEYELTNSTIQSVCYKIAPDSTYSIVIKLNEEGTITFYEFTKNNIGKFLKVRKNKYLIMEAIIKAGIQSGYISIHDLKSKKEVINYLRFLIG